MLLGSTDGGMNIHDAVGIALHQNRREQAHKSGEDHELDAALPKNGDNRFITGLAAGIFFGVEFRPSRASVRKASVIVSGKMWTSTVIMA